MVLRIYSIESLYQMMVDLQAHTLVNFIHNMSEICYWLYCLKPKSRNQHSHSVIGTSGSGWTEEVGHKQTSLKDVKARK